MYIYILMYIHEYIGSGDHSLEIRCWGFEFGQLLGYYGLSLQGLQLVLQFLGSRQFRGYLKPQYMSYSLNSLTRL